MNGESAAGSHSGMPSGDSLRRHADAVVLMPAFNDWAAVRLLLPKIESALRKAHLVGELIIIDDGSSIAAPTDLCTAPTTAIQSMRILALRRNVGHQRAIALGLAFLASEGSGLPVIVMDSDGEDDPIYLAPLHEALITSNRAQIVFAQRSKRSESLLFRTMYQIYKLVFSVLTGESLRFGNFCILSSDAVHRLAAVSELWNNFPAAVLKSRIPRSEIPTARSVRLDGKSHMNMQSLVMHGLSAVSVFSDVVGVRLLIASLLLAGIAAVGLCGVVLIRLSTDLAIPGWATTAGGLLGLLFVQAVMISMVLVFIVLTSRSSTQFIPGRDFRNFVLEVRIISTRERNSSEPSAHYRTPPIRTSSTTKGAP